MGPLTERLTLKMLLSREGRLAAGSGDWGVSTAGSPRCVRFEPGRIGVRGEGVREEGVRAEAIGVSTSIASSCGEDEGARASGAFQ